MDINYITTTYAEASERLAEARARYAAATTKKARREAGEDVEFWLSKKSAMWAAARRFGV